MADSRGALAGKPRVGRPRKIRRVSERETSDELLFAAAALFTEYGYAGTSTRQIAAKAGLQQGSMFHHFERKADILTELLDWTLEPATRFWQVLARLDAPADERLALLTYGDALGICSEPYNVAVLMHLREVRSDEFASFWKKRRRLLAGYEELVRGGTAEGLFIEDDPRMLADLSFGLVESALYWFRRGEDDPVAAAERIAQSVMRVVLRKPSGAEKLVAGGLRRLVSDERFAELQLALPSHAHERRSQARAT